MSEIADRYRRRADAFEAKVAAVRPGQWEDPSPCEKWTARDVVRHIIDMHAVMLRPHGRTLTPAPSVDDDPVAALRAARADVEALLADPALAAFEGTSPAGTMTTEQHIDQVVSADLPLHGWDLARATGQDDTIDPLDVEPFWQGMTSLPPEVIESFRTPGAHGPGVEVFGPEVKVPADAPLQDRLLGFIGRDPRWRP
ncbi:TIGR03086 family metal-binding protein [Spirillospora sp. NPDC047279]|uniref:TIGR03086 family metal-binding protein n=1 Tax=Spirillospora sp. NPDC047279 TaxID=3155478 RepID=UPI0033C1BA17